MSDRPMIKVCGITRLEDARYCAGAGVDFLGFILHEASTRVVDPDLVKQIREWLHGTRCVGVFVDETVDRVNEIVRYCGLDFVQLHGNETPEYCQLVDAGVIKAITIRPGTGVAEIADVARNYAGIADYLLFDTWSPRMHGGTGETFDWHLLGGIDAPAPFFVAGGLTAHNVGEAVRIARPAGIDVSSGVEAAPGIKDFDRLNDFLDAVDRATAAT